VRHQLVGLLQLVHFMVHPPLGEDEFSPVTVADAPLSQLLNVRSELLLLDVRA
jgi:hypothetical protein